MKPQWQKLASLAQEICTLWFQFFSAVFASKGCPFKNILQLDTTNESREVSPFPAGNHKAHINRRVQRHNKHETEQKHKRFTKEVPPLNGQ